MSKETKQDVFDAAVEKAVGMTLVAGYTSYGEKYRKDMQKRYAAATDGDPDAQRTCPYCHDEEGQPCGPNGYYANNLSIGSDGYIEDSDKIKYCQYCGRRLEASHEPA